MTSVVLALADVGLGIPTQEGLERLGRNVRWMPDLAAGPPAGMAAVPDVVVIDADGDGDAVLAAVAAWRALDPPPGILALGLTAPAAGHAAQARVPLCSPGATALELAAAIDGAARMRLATAMTPGLARRVVGLPPGADDAAVVAAARAMDVELARAALRWHAFEYVTATPVIAELRAARALIVPEIELLGHLSGIRTLQTVVRAGPLDPYATARLVWVLASLGAVQFSVEPIDRATPARRALAELRGHLVARQARLAQATFYDVLEVPPSAETPAIMTAVALLGRRYGLAATSDHDLGDRAALAGPCWDQVERAKKVLLDIAARGRYNDWLRARWHELKSQWTVDDSAIQTATAAFARAQHALAAGDPHRALSEAAAAARHHPGHPDYETGLAWARYRVDVIGGADAPAAARRARATAEAATRGVRPWPRALVALALLCVADRDVEAARWHLREVLSIDPASPAARQLMTRLGG
ncbi:MAG: hypothetical protein R3B06_09375 [Kofleriaceae bacterium]